MHRRTFLGATGLTFASTLLAARPLWADDKQQTDSVKKLRDDPSFQPNTLFLTWQRDPTTTMTVQWVAANGETRDTSIRVRKAGDDEWRTERTVDRPFPMTDLKVFRCELTGLTPGSDYEFRIGDESPIWRFRTMPAKATDAISFISGGDVGVNEHATSNTIQAARQDPMFTVIGGDLGYDNGCSPAIALAFLRNYSKHMVGRGGRLIPMVTCIGNHDVDGRYGQPREKAPFFYALFEGLYPQTGYATLDFGDYLSLVLLDTGHTTAIGGEQAAWLEKVLRERADHPHVMAVNHVPAYPSYRSMDGTDNKQGTGEDNRKFWVPLFDKYRVPVVLEHHDHTFKRTRPMLAGSAHDNGVVYLGDGSWGKLRTPKPMDKLSHMVQMSRDYHLSLHRLEGTERFHMALDEFGRVMDVCRTAQRKHGGVSVGG